MNKLEFTKTDKIFTTGAYLKAIECIIDGRKQWRWVVVGFEDDTYFNGEIVDIQDYADSFEDLFNV